MVRKADGCYLFRSHGFKIHASVLSRSPSKAGTLPHLLFFIDFTWVRERAGGLWFCLLIDSAAVIGDRWRQDTGHWGVLFRLVLKKLLGVCLMYFSCVSRISLVTSSVIWKEVFPWVRLAEQLVGVFGWVFLVLFPSVTRATSKNGLCWHMRDPLIPQKDKQHALILKKLYRHTNLAHLPTVVISMLLIHLLIPVHLQSLAAKQDLLLVFYFS